MLFEGTAFEINRIILIRLITSVILIGLFALAASRAKLVPGRAQNLAEMALDFVRVNIAEEILGENARRFVPMITTIFFAVLALNLTGVVPLMNISSNSLIGMPIVLAAWVFVMYLAVGIKKFGLGGYLKNNLLPPGMPKFLYVLVTPIEALQVFLLRPATLALRLAANMIAGHLILTIFAVGTYYLLSHLWTEGADWVAAFGIFSFALQIFMTGFEVLVAFLQAYIFTMLTAVYISGAIHPEH